MYLDLPNEAVDIEFFAFCDVGVLVSTHQTGNAAPKEKREPNLILNPDRPETQGRCCVPVLLVCELNGTLTLDLQYIGTNRK